MDDSKTSSSGDERDTANALREIIDKAVALIGKLDDKFGDGTHIAEKVVTLEKVLTNELAAAKASLECSVDEAKASITSLEAKVEHIADITSLEGKVDEVKATLKWVEAKITDIHANALQGKVQVCAKMATLEAKLNTDIDSQRITLEDQKGQIRDLEVRLWQGHPALMRSRSEGRLPTTTVGLFQ